MQENIVRLAESLAPAQSGLPSPTRTLLLNTGSPDAKRREILAYFEQTFDLYDSLFDCLADERAWFTKAIPLRHPLIFYYGHTAAFFINKLLAEGLIDRRIDPEIEAMVAIGVDEMSWDDLDEKNYAWPSVAGLRAYRAKVRDLVSSVIADLPISLPITWESPAWVILMGIEHERIHLETSSVLIRQLPLAWVRPQAHWPACPSRRHEPAAVPVNSLIALAGGRIVLGKRDATYGWDNEYGSETVDLAPFHASQFLVSNAEYLDFVEAGGYLDARFWTDEGWAWRSYSQAIMPTFWRGRTDHPMGLKLRLMTEEVSMPWDWPVEVNALEAHAFCAWKAADLGRPVQLPTEAEWAHLRARVPTDQPDWDAAPGNINLEYWASSCPIDEFPQGDGFYDIIGNVWQWTRTPINGYDGFKVHPRYDDFSTPTFDGKHDLIKGGSWISTGNEAIASARYAFRRHFFQHAGLRYVISNAEQPVLKNPYETDEQVCQYLDFHYGETHFGVENFSKALADLAIELCPEGGKALDIGCAVGRASVELARHFEAVDGVDFSARFIDVALQLIKQGDYRYTVKTEGDLVDYREASLAALSLGADQASRVAFSQGDALNLKPKYTGYDLVLAANLIDRLREPARFLKDVGARLKPGGVLLLTSPYTWLEEFTPRANWLGAVRENGETVSTYRALQLILAEDFEEIAPPRDVPFVIRETARKFQHTLAQATFWRRR
jgi:5-histidylcysteine sulfoxide synthase/putative 4-mercaptohistidine N1-methyltranferase